MSCAWVEDPVNTGSSVTTTTKRRRSRRACSKSPKVARRYQLGRPTKSGRLPVSVSGFPRKRRAPLPANFREGGAFHRRQRSASFLSLTSEKVQSRRVSIAAQSQAKGRLLYLGARLAVFRHQGHRIFPAVRKHCFCHWLCPFGEVVSLPAPAVSGSDCQG
jgi:hypothetical protein